MRVEPLLFEWRGFYPSRLPGFISSHDLRTMGFPVDVSHRPVADLQSNAAATASADGESVQAFYERSSHVMRAIFDRHPGKGVLVLPLFLGTVFVCCVPIIYRIKLTSSWKFCGHQSYDVEM